MFLRTISPNIPNNTKLHSTHFKNHHLSLITDIFTHYVIVSVFNLLYLRYREQTITY